MGADKGVTDPDLATAAEGGGLTGLGDLAEFF